MPRLKLTDYLDTDLLAVIATHPGITVPELTVKLGLDPDSVANVSRRCAFIEHHGLLTLTDGRLNVAVILGRTDTVPGLIYQYSTDAITMEEFEERVAAVVRYEAEHPPPRNPGVRSRV